VIAGSARDAADSLRMAGFRGSLLTDSPLAPYTTWRIGGPAELLAAPADRADLLVAAEWAAAHAIRWRVLGNGSNLLVSDAGVSGLVLRLRDALGDVAHEGRRIIAGAGASFPAVARRAAALGLSGLEFGAGIPGTIGGAIVMNAGWHEFEIGATVESVEFLDAAGVVRTLTRDDCLFGYRSSRFRSYAGVVLAPRSRSRRATCGRFARASSASLPRARPTSPRSFPPAARCFSSPPGILPGG